ncbi:hypothetical protein [Anoxybacteroides tepidamans]|uniref:hypothetical protein n=1 Tax=Anoxybacteroides tepidamans TaxID=265948 RepID=UPI0004833AE0|nr:hypothetical protein [Anoxybacillus tepidamans]
MLQTSLSKAMLDETARRIREELTFPAYEDALKKGLKLYREGFVYNAILVEKEIVQANVFDEKVYKPVIHLTDLSQSHCECSTFLCPHLLALFFYLYANVSSVGELVRKWNTKQPSVPPKLAKASEIAQRSASVSDWHEQFQSAYEQFLSQYRTIDYWFAHHLCDRFFPSLLDKAPYATVEKRFYHLHAALFTFCRLIEYGEHFERLSYQRSYWESAVSDFTGIIRNKCGSLLNTDISPSYLALLEDSCEYARAALFAGQGFTEMRVRVYQIVWNVFAAKGLSIEQEQEKLQKEKENDAARFECSIALAHLAFLRGSDEEVFDLTKNMDAPDVLYYTMFWLRELGRLGQWMRMKAWWSPLIDVINSFHAFSYNYKMQMTQEILYLLEQYTDATGDSSDYEQFLQLLLPYSAYDYSHFLISRKQYKKWVDLHLIAGVEIENIHRLFLTAIEKHDRSLLLPLYHQGVQKMIQAKNRQSYKRAVKYLKKMRAYYRALKRYDVWLEYRDRLLEETKRLRAFYEELQKGKLLND